MMFISFPKSEAFTNDFYNVVNMSDFQSYFMLYAANRCSFYQVHNPGVNISRYMYISDVFDTKETFTSVTELSGLLRPCTF